MKRKHVFYPLIFIASIISSVLFTNMMLYAVEQQGEAYMVVITIRPQRLLVVNNDLIIQKIVSNTAEDVRPIVVLENASGEELPYSDSVRREYEFLKPSLNFSKPGIIYQREERPVQALIKRSVRTFDKWWSF